MNEALRILLLDDDDVLRGLVGGELGKLGHKVTPASRVADARRLLEEDEFDVALVDLRLPDGDGLEVLRHARARSQRTEVVLLTGHGTIDTAIEAMRAGAFDYLSKPCSIRELEVVLGKAREHQRLIERNSILRDGLAPADPGATFIGQSAALREIRALVDRLAANSATVMILGETGVGKEIVARLIHARSDRRRQPLVTVDCTTLHDELLNSELFGHEKGAYTGASQPKHGLFEVADGGTLFLDEVGDLSPQTQTKLLRVLETGCFRHVGGTRELHVDVRIIAATNRDLQDMMRRGFFRSDLYFRLNTLRLAVPPLRERGEDIPLLAEHFLARLNGRFGQRKRFAPATLARLATYRFPGNVRELLHAVESAVAMCDGESIELSNLPAEIRAGEVLPGGKPRTLAEVEKDHLLAVLQSVGNRAGAAAALGISERTLYRKLREYGVEAED